VGRVAIVGPLLWSPQWLTEAHHAFGKPLSGLACLQLRRDLQLNQVPLERAESTEQVNRWRPR
jgi:hypothetical protein